MRRTLTAHLACCLLSATSFTAARAAELPAGAAKGEDQWMQLFDGSEESIAKHWRWRAPRPRKSKSGQIIQPGKWHALEDGSLECLPRCGYIWTQEKFADFVIDFDFKVSKKCNSGLFFRTDPRNAVQGGMEIQILDSYGKKQAGKHDLAALYDCQAPTRNAAKPAGEWQHMTLTAIDSRLTVVLNGETVLEVDLNQWTEPRKNPDGSKNKFRRAYRDMPRTGHIGFQDHGHKVWFRNIRIKLLGK